MVATGISSPSGRLVRVPDTKCWSERHFASHVRAAGSQCDEMPVASGAGGRLAGAVADLGRLGRARRPRAEFRSTSRIPPPASAGDCPRNSVPDPPPRPRSAVCKRLAEQVRTASRHNVPLVARRRTSGTFSTPCVQPTPGPGCSHVKNWAGWGGRLELVPDVADEVAFEAADGVAVGFAFGCSALGCGGWRRLIWRLPARSRRWRCMLPELAGIGV